MTAAGFALMTCSTALVLGLCAFCIVRLLRTGSRGTDPTHAGRTAPTTGLGTESS